MDLNDPSGPATGGVALTEPATETTAPAPPTAIGRDIVVIGASAGGVHALRQLASLLPADYPGSVFVVMHISPEAHSELPAILARAGPLPASAAQDGALIEPGQILVAPPDHHLLVEPGHVRVIHGPRENRHRPAIDPLLRSAAWAYGPRVIGVVLTGNLDDGTAGLWAVKSCGGTTVVQEPAEAEHPEMPSNAILHNRVDHRLELAEIAALLVRLATTPIDHTAPGERPDYLSHEIEAAKMKRDLRSAGRLGTLSAFTCPTCRGALWELDEEGHLRYRCHTGHAYSLSSLVVDQGIAVEESLYAAMRALDEKAAALRRLADRWPDRIPGIKQDYEQRARQLEGSAGVLRSLLSGALA